MLQVDREKRITLAELRACPLLTVGVPDDLPPPAKRPRLAAPERRDQKAMRRTRGPGPLARKPRSTST